MTEKKIEIKGFPSALTLLGIAFVVLKLCGVIGWSWWWVTLPFWIGIAFALTLVAAVLAAILSVFALCMKGKK